MSQVERRRLEAYLDRPLDDLMAELDLYAPGVRGPAEVWRKIATPVQQRICQEWQWCRVRQDARFENDVDLAAAVLVALTTRALRLPVDVDLLLVAAILVKRGLDNFCGCP